MLFYFTATGNSLYVAKQIEENLISIPQVIQNKDLTFKDEAIGIIFPVFAAEPPKMVIDFINKATFQTDYLYFIMTYGMSQADAPEFTNNLANQSGKKVDYIGSIHMVDNYLPVFDMNEEMAMDKHIEEQIEKVKKAINDRKREIPEATEEDRKLHANVARMNKFIPSFNNGKQIKVTKKCVGCGICEKVCPVGNFFMKDDVAKRTQKTCEFCLACAHNCPQKAIKMKIRDKNPNARYRNEHITLKEIIASNHQK
ncbi:EFR1 family ferrodoxin [Eubacteriaceae bacterium ES2]|nr:EFR1 family ferrodoxin [Eubacteriaceae bacterium ES2]